MLVMLIIHTWSSYGNGVYLHGYNVGFFVDCAEYRGAEADHESGDWSDQLEEGGNQVQEKRAIPGRPGVSQPTHVTERYDAFYLCYGVYREPIH